MGILTSKNSGVVWRSLCCYFSEGTVFVTGFQNQKVGGARPGRGCHVVSLNKKLLHVVLLHPCVNRYYGHINIARDNPTNGMTAHPGRGNTSSVFSPGGGLAGFPQKKN